MTKTTIQKLIDQKNIGFLGGLCFLFNALSGPAIPYTASNFSSPGWLFTVLCYIIFTLFSGLANAFLIESMQAIPGNKHFQGHVEFSTLINFFFGPNLHLFGQFILYCAIQSNVIQSLVLTAQSTDQFLIDVAGTSCGLTLDFRWICIRERLPGASPSPFGDTLMLFTIGFLAVLVFSIPLFFVDLDSSVSMIIGFSMMTLIIAAQWITASVIHGLEPRRMPVITTPIDVTYAETMGIVMLNLGCATVIPTWVNIKAMHVRTQSVMWNTFFLTGLFYIMIGIFFSLGFDSNPSNNSLQALLEEGTPILLCRITVGLYSYVMLLPSVPVNCIVSSSNLVQNKIVSKKAAIFLAFVVPILVSIPLQTRNYLFVFLTWTSLIFVSIANFLMPLIVYLKCVEFRHEFNQDRILTYHQLKLLGEIHHHSTEIAEYIQERSQDFPDLPKHFHNHPTIVLTPAKNTQAPYGSDAALASESVIQPQVIEYLGKPTALHKSISEYSKISIRFREKNESYPALTPDLFKAPDDHIEASDYTKLSVKPHHDLKVEDIGYEYVDPKEVGIDDHLFDEDVPDPDLEGPEGEMEMHPIHHHNHHHGEFLSAQKPSSFDVNSQNSGISSAASLPRDPAFKTPPFRAIPKWVPLHPVTISKSLLAITTIISITNVILHFVFPSSN